MKKVALALMLCLAFSGMAQVNDLLIARNTGKYPIHTGDTIRVFGFTRALKEEVKIPGPTLVYNEGDSVTIDLWNISQGAPHTIHLHGLDVDQANDGVPHLSFDVAHMDHGFYRFKAPHAGTYLYHCHVVSTIHVQAGMYGLIIIRPADGSNTTWSGGHSYDRDISWMTSELDTNWHKDDVLEHPHDTGMHIMKVEIPEFHPQHFLVNGLSQNQLSDSSVALYSTVNEQLYLRIANIGYYGNKVHFPAGYNVQIVSSDGRPLPTPEVSDSLTIYPGERYGILLKATSQFTGNISVDYFDLNTNAVKNTQSVPAVVQGYFSQPEPSLAQLTAYPNPAGSDLALYTGDFIAVKWIVTDITGTPHPLTITASDAHSFRCNVERLPAGCYFFQAINKNGETIRTTVLKN